MHITKIALGALERVYSTCIMNLNGALHYIIASEAANQCRVIHVDTMIQRVIWDKPGGTMSIVPVPGAANEFIATQRFLPGFSAQESRIVHARVDERNEWTVTPIMTIPFLHRFDLFHVGSDIHFVGGVLCGSKAYKEDWSDPGKLVAGVLHDDVTKPFELTDIRTGITKHHGFCATTWNDKKAFIVTGVEGAFVAYPPASRNGAWKTEQLFDYEISDCAVCDIDGDGELEIATIEPFHGDAGKIYKRIDGAWMVIHEHTYEFGHVVWGGRIRHKPAFIIGARKGSRELILFTFEDGVIKETLIDNVGGPSNIAVADLGDRDVILAANRQSETYCVYEITD